MRIEINPSPLLNLQNICEVLYKLHPFVLDKLVEIQISLRDVLNAKEVDFSKEPKKPEEPKLPKTQEEFNKMIESKGVKVTNIKFDNKNEAINFLERFKETNEKSKLLRTIREMKENENSCLFSELRKYIQLDTYEYIPIKIYMEVEDLVVGRKLKELVKALEKTRAPEQFYLNKKEMDEDAFFAEGYGLTMNKEQKKKIR